MNKNLLLRSVAIFSLLAFLMMLTLGQIALSSTTFEQRSAEAECENFQIHSYLGNTVVVRIRSSLEEVHSQPQVCVSTLSICLSETKNYGPRGFDLIDIDRTVSRYCTSARSTDFEGEELSHIRSAMMQVAQFNREAPDSIKQLPFDLIQMNRAEKSQEAKDQLKGFIYNLIWLQGGT